NLTRLIENGFNTIRSEKGLRPLKLSSDINEEAQAWAQAKVGMLKCSAPMTTSLRSDYRHYGQLAWKRVEDGLVNEILLSSKALLSYFRNFRPWDMFRGQRMFTEEQWAKTRKFGIGFATHQ